MRSKYVRRKLGDLVRVKHGFAFKGEHFVDEPTSHVLVTPGNFAIGGGFQDTKLKFYRGPVPEEYVLKAGDLVVTMTDLSRAADTLGFSAVVPKHHQRVYLHNQRIGLVEVLRPMEVSKAWLHYLMRTSDYRAWVVGSATGSTVKHTSPSRICDFEFDLPTIDVQKEAAATLDALESRIELLRQTNATLESIAQALFKSWFIDFDPVRAKAEGRETEGMDAAKAALFPAEFEESALGLIPKGWGPGQLDIVCTNPRVQAKPGHMPGDTPYIGLEHMPRKSIALDSAGTAEGLESGKFWFERNDVLFGKLRPYFHKVGLAPCRGVCSTDILVLRPKHVGWLGFLAMHASSDPLIAHTTQLSNGARMPRTSWNDVAGFQVVIPPLKIASAFDAVVVPVFERIHANIDAARSLSDLRDTLLPRLISGKLRLPEVQEQVEDALA
jgi:type I restriction enzyme S subunit